MKANLRNWHEIVKNKNWEKLDHLLADDIEFHSPFLWKPKIGKDTAAFILKNVSEIFIDFTYHREWIDGNDIALEFSAKVNDLNIKGIDLMHWNADNQIDRFEVMIRPANGLMALGQQMGQRFQSAGFDPG